MPRNQKLTKVIAVRTIKAVTVEPGSVLVLFDDRSNMKIKTAAPATIAPGGKVKSVRETKAEFKIDLKTVRANPLLNRSGFLRCRPRQK